MLDRLFAQMDIAVLEPQANGTLLPAAALPMWLQNYLQGTGPEIQVDWPFLTDFLGRAEELWQSGKDGSLPSGFWTETDLTGKDRLLQALAVSLSGKRFLLIELARVPLEQAQALLQRGRQTNLDFRTVKRKQKSLKKSQQRYMTLLEAVPDTVLILQQDGSILEYSMGREELFEDVEFEVGKKVTELLPQDLTAQLIPQLDSVISEGRPQLWRYRGATLVLEILMLATGQDEAMCILRKRL